MLKLTRTKSGLSILTIKAFGHYANMSFGKSAKPRTAPAARVVFHHSYEINVAASEHANDICARLFGRENVNTTDATMKAWMRYRDEFLAAHPKTESVTLAPAKPAKPARRAFPWHGLAAADAFGLAVCAVVAVSAYAGLVA